MKSLKLYSLFKSTSPSNCLRSFSYSSVKYNLKEEKWDIISAVSLERKPVITRDLTGLESKFNKLLLQIEYERSHKSNFELRVESDKKRAQDVKEGKINIADMESFPQQTGQDFLDASLEELKAFHFAPRKSSSKSDMKSVTREWDRYLLLLVNEKIGENYQWVLPQGKHNPGETLRQTAERVLQEKCGGKIKSKFMGNAPCGFYKYKYPKLARKDMTIGAKIFFFKAEFLSGQVELEKDNCKDYEWATRQELQKVPSEYLKSVKMFLIDEEH